MKLKRKRRAVVVLMVMMALMLITSVVLALPGIDNFDVNSLPVLTRKQANIGTPVSNFVTAPGLLLGDERDVQLDLLVAPNNFFSSQSGVFGSLLALNNATNYESVLTIQWDGIDGSMALKTDGLGTQNLNVHGNAIWIRVLNDDNPIPVRFDVYSDAGANSGSQTIILPGGINNTPTDIAFPFTSFSGSINFSSVSAIVMTVGGLGYPSVDLDITAVQVSTGVPTAVTFQDISTSTESTPAIFAVVVALVAVLTGVGVFIGRKQQN
ncbi:MAG: hypothetical protein GY796_16525 [Chloroflexi bacterium]|nr:hypothetical protein [Chloroflexota bacterium]